MDPAGPKDMPSPVPAREPTPTPGTPSPAREVDSGFEVTVRAPSSAMPAQLPSQDPRARQGRPFGRYRLLQEVGRGGMGVVWKAWDLQLERVVALKQIAGEASREQVERFLREARLAAKLSHPSIVQVHDVGEHDGVPYYTSEFIDGEPLERAMLASVPPARRVAWVEEIALALAYAHQHGVVHRDVKPGNILIDAEGRPRITDFGLAKETTLQGETSTLTASGALVGTPAYMSPEQAAGRATEIGPASDQFSLGVVLYQLLTGARPFEAASLRDLLDSIVMEDPVPPTRASSQVHRDLEAICLKALEKDPSRRYPSMQDLAADLRRFLDGKPIQARPVSLFGKVARKAARHRGVFAAGALAALAVLALAAWLVADHLSRRRVVADRLGEAQQAESIADRAHGEDAEKLCLAAKEAYARVTAVDDGSADAHRGLDRVNARLTALADARTAADREALQILEDARPSLDQATGWLYDRDARYDELTRRVEVAEKQIRQAIEKAPKLALAHHLLGKARLLLGWEVEAEQEWEAAVACDPGFAPAHLELARLRLEHAFIDLQIGHFLQLPTMEAESRRLVDSAKKEVDEVLRSPHRGDVVEDRITLEVVRVMEAYTSKDVGEFIARCKQALAQYASSRGAEQLVWLQGLSQTGQEEMASYDAALRVRPHFPLALFTRALAHAERGETDAALRDYDEALLIRPRFLAALANRASLKEKRGDGAGALADLMRALEIDPDYLPALVNRASVRGIQGELELGLADATRAVAIAPREARVHLERSHLLGLLGRKQECDAELDAAVALDPKNPVTLCHQADRRAEEGDLPGALRLADEAVSAEPKEETFYVYRLALRVHAGDTKGALADCDAALRLDPNDLSVRITRARLRAMLGDRDGYLQDAEAAVLTAPEHPECWLERGMAHEKKGDSDAAIADYDKTADVIGAHEPGAEGQQMAACAGLWAAGLLASRDKDRALSHIAQAVATGAATRSQIERDARFAPLHEDPKWAELLRRAR